jgi:hypothetical protein
MRRLWPVSRGACRPEDTIACNAGSKARSIRTVLPRLVIVVALGACMPRYSYERPTLTTPPASQPEECYERGKLELSAGEGSWTKQYGTSVGLVSYTVTEFWSSSGIAFRAGKSIRPADQIVAALPDPELAAAYAANLQRTRRAHTMYPIYRNVSLGIAFGGLGLALLGLGMTLANPDSKDGLYVAIGGGVAAMVSIIPAIGTGLTHREAIEHDVDSHLFVRTEWAPRLVPAVTQHNQRIAAACGVERADVPMTIRARQMLGAVGSAATR